MAGLPSGGGKRGSVPFAFRAMKSADGIVEGAETVTGSYRTPSGTPGGAVHGPRTVPTASGSARANPRQGKGVNQKNCREDSLFSLFRIPKEEGDNDGFREDSL